MPFHLKEQEMDRKGKTMKNWQLWILPAGIAFICVVFLYLNFRLAASNTQFEKNITTTGMGDGLPYAMQRKEKINLSLVGEGPLIAALQEALAVEMIKAGIGDVELVQGMEPKYQNPVLVVKVGRPRLFWTPFFATSRFTIQAGYSSTGDTTFMGETPATVNNLEGPILIMFGEYKISDHSWGLISRLGYYHILVDYLTRQIVFTLKDLYKVST
jgi:hypothetical protein